jgi:hypothetical protein
VYRRDWGIYLTNPVFILSFLLLRYNRKILLIAIAILHCTKGGAEKKETEKEYPIS